MHDVIYHKPQGDLTERFMNRSKLHHNINEEEKTYQKYLFTKQSTFLYYQKEENSGWHKNIITILLILHLKS